MIKKRSRSRAEMNERRKKCFSLVRESFDRLKWREKVRSEMFEKILKNLEKKITTMTTMFLLLTTYDKQNELFTGISIGTGLLKNESKTREREREQEKFSKGKNNFNFLSLEFKEWPWIDHSRVLIGLVRAIVNLSDSFIFEWHLPSDDMIIFDAWEVIEIRG